MSELITNLNNILDIKSDIRSAIENKGVDMTGKSFPDYPAAISQISGGSGAVIKALQITSNGTYTAGEGVDGYSPVEVNVPSPQFVTETLNVSANGTYNPGQGVDGYSQVVVDVPQSVTGFTQKEITEGTIEIINLDNSASFVASDVFGGNKTIQTVNLPYATNVGNRAFQRCSKLSQVNLPMCMTIGDNAFYFCGSLSQVSLPVCSTIGWNAFQGCDSLSQISLPVCSTIGGNALWGCLSLSIITIGYSSICSLVGSNVFGNTQITSSTGSIYVPVSLVDSYKSATNWSYFSTQIFPIPE